MKAYTYSDARRNFSRLLDMARTEEILISRRNGETYSLTLKSVPPSPFDIPGIKTRATTDDILAAVRDSRAG